MSSSKGFWFILIIFLSINLITGIPRSLELEKQVSQPVKENNKTTGPAKEDKKAVASEPVKEEDDERV